MRVALYARYSGDNQREASIFDQLRICRLHAEKMGWDIVEEYTDPKISGASMFLRPGIQALISDAGCRRFDVVLAEAMDRLSRDQEDMAGIYKRMTFSDIKIITLSEGEVSPLHVGLKGTMNALFLKDLADKVRRGLRGRVELGKSGGGNSYGYDVVRRMNATGELERGDRTINEVQANVVLRIFRDYIDGKSPKAIAFELNRQGVESPSGVHWGASTINGNCQRGTGILNNEMYVGKIVWNRQRFIKDPSSGKRQARLNPQSDWVIQDVPELRIVPEDLWQEAKRKQASLMLPRGEQRANASFRDRRRPKHLLTGLVRCGCCGGVYTSVSGTLLGCSAAKGKGTCDNKHSIRRDVLDQLVLGALKRELMQPDLFAEFCHEFTREVNRLRASAGNSITAAKAEIKKIDRDLDMLLNVILRGGAAEKINAKMISLEARKKELEQELLQSEAPAPMLHPNMALHYHRQIEALHVAISGMDEASRLQARDILHSMLSAIYISPDGEQHTTVDIRGDLAGIIAICRQQKGRPKAAVNGAIAYFDAEFASSNHIASDKCSLSWLRE
ncbi:Site-specific DNA recombinase [Sphingobium sp. AP50]|uniref:recombinase family protein n=1 Tax=Sphingobium sp. AP50 TaxID=1884369 RepID=UPI0008BC9FD5|nr:recombinase family protein [Sphingobium sp. AP50]SEJ74548.1 Site-specific DNA recombinase [Sphingobium sp. AP50]